MAMLVPVVLAGGSGTRLWPLSREDRPKQFLSLGGADSLLRRTVRRALPLADADCVLTVADESHFFLLQDELGQIHQGLLDGILLEPAGRNTAAALAYAATVAEERWPGSLLWVMPADHIVEDVPALHRAVEHARTAARDGWIVTFGIKPDRAETGFGYIERGDRLDGNDDVCGVSEFIEKPPLQDAERMLAGGRHLWNSGMLMTSARVFLDELSVHAPALSEAVLDAVAARKPGRPARVHAALYDRIPSEPFDKAVLERSDKVAVVPCALGWSDVGTWNNLWELMPRDVNDNVVEGPVIVDRTSNCLLHASKRLIACTGVRDLAVIETSDAILIADRSDATGVRRILQTLKAQNRPEISNGHVGAHPWGSYRVLHEGEGFKIREIVVSPGGKLSLRRRNQRQEHWVVVKGTARVTRGARTHDVPEGGSVEITIATRHRLENPGADPLHLIEVQYGEHLDEDDIVTFEDAYDRVRAAS